MTTPTTPMFKIADVPGKGKGVVATRFIPRGKEIMAEKPFVTLSVLMSFQADAVARETGYFQTNGISMLERFQIGMFEHVCRLNHSCAPHAQYFWDNDRAVEVVHAVVDIASGQEILVFYIEPSALFSSRQASIQKGFDFACSCNLCSVSVEERTKGDNNRREYQQLVDAFPSIMQRSPGRALQMLERAIGIIEAEGLWSELPVRYYDGFQCVAAYGDLKNAIAWATAAADAQAVTRGPNSKDAREMAGYAKNPRSHWEWGTLGSGEVLSGPPIITTIARGAIASSPITAAQAPSPASQPIASERQTSSQSSTSTFTPSSPTSAPVVVEPQEPPKIAKNMKRRAKQRAKAREEKAAMEQATAELVMAVEATRLGS
ncbi:hypothetical protein IAT38_003105 [Cryptococcus sp. DSM 104549]